MLLTNDALLRYHSKLCSTNLAKMRVRDKKQLLKTARGDNKYS